MTLTKKLLTPEVVFDPSLGGAGGGGTRYRDKKTGRFVPNSNKNEDWYCQKSPTGAHHWIISENIGQCRYCQITKEFSPLFIYKKNPPFISKKRKNGPEDNLIGI